MSNPYSAPYHSPHQPFASGPGPSTGYIKAPAIALLVVGGLGLLVSFINLVMAFVVEPTVDPTAPEIVQQMQRNSAGAVAALIQGAFVIVNGVIIYSMIQMMTLRSWGWALAGSILAMIDLGGCCCFLGLPCGIWSLIVLMQENTKSTFAQARQANDVGNRGFPR